MLPPEQARSPKENQPSPEPSPAEIAFCAYLIWEQEGCPDGRAAEHWQQAEAQLRATRQHALAEKSRNIA
jgi:hypothetical protein